MWLRPRRAPARRRRRPSGRRSRKTCLLAWTAHRSRPTARHVSRTRAAAVAGGDAVEAAAGSAGSSTLRPSSGCGKREPSSSRSCPPRPSKAATARVARVAVVNSYTTAQFVPMLRLAALRAGIDAQVLEGDYDQYQQELLDPDSTVYGFDPDYVVSRCTRGRCASRPSASVRTRTLRSRPRAGSRCGPQSASGRGHAWSSTRSPPVRSRPSATWPLGSPAPASRWSAL